MATLLRTVIDATGLSRRKAFAAIREGHVRVDGTVVAEPSSELSDASVTLDGAPIAAPAHAKTYLMLNKPAGYVTTRSDELGRPTVFDLLPRSLRPPALHPVGRLDLGTSGLLLLTDDGDFTYRLTHPKHEVDKEYWLRLSTPATDANLSEVRRGVELDGDLRVPVRLQRLKDKLPFQLSITLREGRKRQVRRMFEAVGHRVSQLCRVREGPLRLYDLEEGECRRLTREELALLGVER